MHEFTAWPKTPRLFRGIVISEKIDGTNAAINIDYIRDEHNDLGYYFPRPPGEVWMDGKVWQVSAQSRKRIITPQADNYGFARWVYDNAAELVTLLGRGLHFGEWWGQGIQRRYGIDHRAFSLFNTERYGDIQATVGGVPVRPVPVLYEGPFSEHMIRSVLNDLRLTGSRAARGFMEPEGICVYHTQSRQVFKVTLDNYDAGKWEAA